MESKRGIKKRVEVLKKLLFGALVILILIQIAAYFMDAFSDKIGYMLKVSYLCVVVSGLTGWYIYGKSE